jgi:phospho-N-acetylmuramoyl-pentapeptide-transferase
MGVRPVVLIGCLSLCGGVLGFLKFNHYPAKIFMGDTGSMFIGGMMVGVGMLTRCAFPMILFCLTSVCSSLSVMLQVGYFKLTHGKRLLKMSPIHHHFELCGWSEVKIWTVFTLVSLAMCVLAWVATTPLK